MPDRRCKKFNATRSAFRIERARPRTSMMTSPAATSSPSRQFVWMSVKGSTCRKASAADPMPATIAFSRTIMRPVACSVSGTKKSVVTSPSPMSSLRAAAMGSYCLGFMSSAAMPTIIAKCERVYLTPTYQIRWSRNPTALSRKGQKKDSGRAR